MLGDVAAFEILDYADVPFMNQAGEHLAPDSVSRVRGIVKAADGIWFLPRSTIIFFRRAEKSDVLAFAPRQRYGAAGPRRKADRHQRHISRHVRDGTCAG